MDQASSNDKLNSKVVIIDTGCANLSSVRFAVERLGYTVTISREPDVLRNADKLFLPGVGTAQEAMKNLADRELIELVKSLTQPVLGICLGMQLLAEFSAEDDVVTLGLISGTIDSMPNKGVRLPHMGWNQIIPQQGHPLFKDIPSGSYFYFVHSYALAVGSDTIATCTHGAPFTAAVHRDNFYGVQFHPERSSKAGAQLIKNFLEM
ncbi:imidazole glycerol phosphate synthase subunit HisH [Moritella viscosa]|uniref:Imidazole glycerol phosphate synthase subunit HisH n=1 Tax=Moritella viscosa TaxID=80854 RepID=A0ABY1HH59_9GAMM|nr:imidazole glycerol phosphate synthase subunit HisH [Moritella viscosa]CED60246.1 imidazole glycerol phosphate synthase subunit HisH [Moritella viscosa]SGY98571.1 Putative glutamine amidotransferase [Moritella viscosa]SGZ05481.1 Putative glutamine amidotransferase [Moritella viscosa]SGZ05663.1 Putative glutamine amidotransferase [Moritella viscosa]SGZ12741.1 Putative glutamine amidotransferase [Moritella viscosa]